MTRRRGPRRPAGRSRASVVGVAGWILADVMLALLIVFLVSTPESPLAASSTPTGTPTPTRTPKPTLRPTVATPSSPSYAVRPLDDKIVILDPIAADFAGLRGGDGSARAGFLIAFDAALAQAADRDPSLRSRPAGFVIVYGYAPTGNLGVGKQAAADVYALLLDQRPQFRQARTTPDPGNWTGGSIGQIKIYAWFYV